MKLAEGYKLEEAGNEARVNEARVLRACLVKVRVINFLAFSGVRGIPISRSFFW